MSTVTKKKSDHEDIFFNFHYELGVSVKICNTYMQIKIILASIHNLKLVIQSCLTLILWTVTRQAPIVLGILQARVLEWVAISFSNS